MKKPAEYIWIDGSQLKSKTLMLEIGAEFKPDSDVPDWDVDVDGQTFIAKPVYYAEDPVRPRRGVLLLTELFKTADEPADINERAKLRIKVAASDGLLPIFAVQQYGLGTSAKEKLPRSVSRRIVEDHMRFCNEAGIAIEYYNASDLGSIEFGIDLENEKIGGPLYTADQIWLARWFLERAAEAEDVKVRFDKTHKLEFEILSAGEDGNIAASSIEVQADADPYTALCNMLKQVKNDKSE